MLMRTSRRACLCLLAVALACLPACKALPAAAYVERHDFPVWPAREAKYNAFVSGYLAPQGYKGKFQTDLVRMRGLAELAAARLRLEDSGTRDSVERLLGPPYFEVEGDLTRGLSPTPVAQIGMNVYAGPSDFAWRTVVGKDPTATERNAAPYRDLESARAMETMVPSGVHPLWAVKSSIYLMADYLGLPGPRDGDAVVVMYDEEDRRIGFYRIWYIDSLYDRSLIIPQP